MGRFTAPIVKPSGPDWVYKESVNCAGILKSGAPVICTNMTLLSITKLSHVIFSGCLKNHSPATKGGY